MERRKNFFANIGSFAITERKLGRRSSERRTLSFERSASASVVTAEDPVAKLVRQV
jgi:hypothetical protein